MAAGHQIGVRIRLSFVGTSAHTLFYDSDRYPSGVTLQMGQVITHEDCPPVIGAGSAPVSGNGNGNGGQSPSATPPALPALVPARPALVPALPALVPALPALVPALPALVPALPATPVTPPALPQLPSSVLPPALSNPLRLN